MTFCFGGSASDYGCFAAQVDRQAIAARVCAAAVGGAEAAAIGGAAGGGAAPAAAAKRDRAPTPNSPNLGAAKTARPGSPHDQPDSSDDEGSPGGLTVPRIGAAGRESIVGGRVHGSSLEHGSSQEREYMEMAEELDEHAKLA